jgi:2,3-bisphosphoglycerate-dependent phosphoglycerate mutase
MMEKQKTTLLVIRHGETVWNREKRLQGHGDSPLTDTGLRQVRALGKRMQAIHFDELIASDLERTQETASIISEYTGHSIQSDYRLRERNYGILEGLPLNKIKNQYPEIYEILSDNNPNFVIPEGESYQHHYQRNVDFFEEYIAKKEGTTAALVVHGGVLDSLFRYIARLPLEQPRCFVAINTSLNIVTHGTFYGTLRWVIKTWGDTGHLNGIGNLSV